MQCRDRSEGSPDHAICNDVAVLDKENMSVGAFGVPVVSTTCSLHAPRPLELTAHTRNLYDVCGDKSDNIVVRAEFLYTSAHSTVPWLSVKGACCSMKVFGLSCRASLFHLWYVCMYVCILALLEVFALAVHTHAQMYMLLSEGLPTYSHARARTHTHTHTQTHKCTLGEQCTYLSSSHIQVPTYTHILNMHTHTHAHTHTHIHTSIRFCGQ